MGVRHSRTYGAHLRRQSLKPHHDVPFTPTHVLAVTPLWPLRDRLPFAALAIGAMVPDVGLFFPIIDYAQGHSPAGLFTACLPIGAAIFLLFDTVMRRPLAALLPMWFQKRLDVAPRIPTTQRPATHLAYYAGLIVAVVFGAFTHQCWDAFTHQGRWGTELVPALNETVAIGGRAIPRFKVLQYGCTLAGLPLLAILALVFFARIPPNESASDAGSFRLRLLAALAACATPLLVGAYVVSTHASYYRALGVTIRLSGAILFLLCISYCVGFQLLTRVEPLQHRADR